MTIEWDLQLGEELTRCQIKDCPEAKKDAQDKVDVSRYAMTRCYFHCVKYFQDRDDLHCE